MQWLMEHYLEIFAVWAGLLGVAQVIVRLTPTDKDDKILSKIGAVTQKLRNLLSLQAPNAKSKDQD